MAFADGHIRCGTCGETKPQESFSPSIAKQGYGRCRDCAQEANRLARARDPERFRAYRRAFVARNPESAKDSRVKWEKKKRAAYEANPPTDGMIRCSNCKQEKHISGFQPSAVMRGCGVCRACKQAAKRDYEKRNKDKVNAAARSRRHARGDEWRAQRRDHYHRNKPMYRRYNLSRYAITPEEYDRILTAQGGGCACCGKRDNRDGKRLFVDHDHDTGAVRGILCNKCNVGIGALGDSIEGLHNAIRYPTKEDNAGVSAGLLF